MKRTKKISVCAVFSALTVVLLFLAAVFEVMDLTIVAVTSLLVIAAHIEIRSPYDYAIWLCGSALSFILLPSKLPAVLYFLFGGIYPILKAYFERMPRLFGWFFKFLYFNAFLTLSILAARFILLLPETDYSFSVGIYALGNLAFFCYDFAVTGLIRMYVTKWRRQLGLHRFFRN